MQIMCCNWFRNTRQNSDIAGLLLWVIQNPLGNNIADIKISTLEIFPGSQRCRKKNVENFKNSIFADFLQSIWTTDYKIDRLRVTDNRI